MGWRKEEEERQSQEGNKMVVEEAVEVEGEPLIWKEKQPGHHPAAHGVDNKGMEAIGLEHMEDLNHHILSTTMKNLGKKTGSQQTGSTMTVRQLPLLQLGGSHMVGGVSLHDMDHQVVTIQLHRCHLLPTHLAIVRHHPPLLLPPHKSIHLLLRLPLTLPQSRFPLHNLLCCPYLLSRRAWPQLDHPPLPPLPLRVHFSSYCKC